MKLYKLYSYKSVLKVISSMSYTRIGLIALVLAIIIILAATAYYITRAPSPTTTISPTSPLTYTPTPMITTPTPSPTPSREELLKPIVDAARREGKLVIYSTLDRPSAEPLLQRFKELYPFIEIEYVELGTATLFSRFRSEVASGAPTADILWSPAVDLQLILINEGHAQPYKVTFYDKLPGEAKYKDIAYTTSFTLFAPVYNKEKMPENLRPKSFGDILNLLANRKDLFPRNSICSFDPIKSGYGLIAMYYQHKMMEPYFTMIYTRASEIGIQLHAASGPQLERVKTGECILSISLIANYAFREAKVDPRIGVFIPEDYAFLIPRVIFITKQASHPNAAKLFLEFVLSIEGQRLLAKVGEVTIAENPEIPELSLPQIKKLSRIVIVVSPGDDIMRELLREDVRRNFQEYFKKLVGG